MDIVSAASAVSAVGTLLEQAIKILSRIRKAHERQKDAARFFEKQLCELSDLVALIDLVKNERSLQNTAVTTELTKLAAVEQRLVEWLKKADPKPRGALRQFSHQLIRGSAEHKHLAEIFGELGCVKADLRFRIELSSLRVLEAMNGKVTDRVSLPQVTL
jgi:hypothetical protein